MNFENTFIGRPNTVKTYQSLFKHHIEPLDLPAVIGKRLWNDSSTGVVLSLWESKGLSRRTRITLIRILRDYLSFLGGPKINSQKIIKSLERSEQQKEISTLNKSQAEELMRITKQIDPNFYPILLLGLHAGLRRGEIFGLRCGDVDLLKKRIRVAHNYDGPTKNGKTRYVPMSDELERTMLEARNLLMRPVHEKVFEVMNPNPRLRRLTNLTKLPKIRFHDLRHSFATMALENKISPRTVADWLGHSNVTITMSIYWNLTDVNTDLNFLPGG